MTDIQLGDPVIDMANGRAMVVLERVADRADTWSDRNDYDLCGNYGNDRCGAQADDVVFECAYVASLQSEPSKTYAFPESRLGRPAYERASDAYGRVYDLVLQDVLEELFALAANLDENWAVEPDNFEDALAKLTANAGGLDDATVDEARELAEVDAVIGSGGDD